jgi:hypothetical protein
LIITSSGGGGLLQAAFAKEQEIKAQHPNAVIILRDVMKDWTWSLAGKFFVGLWNQAQRKGNVRAQALLGSGAPIIEYFFWPYIFFYSLRTLFREDIDQVIDTQVMGTSAVLKALRLFNRARKKKIHLEKVLVDLPTKKAAHFFVPIKALSAKDRKLFKLITVPPLLEKGETEEQFWRKHCNLSHFELQYEDFYVRQAFRKFRHAKRKEEPFQIKTSYKNSEELALLQKSFQRGSIQAEVQKGGVLFQIAPADRLFTILLGSQPASLSTLTYVKRFLQIAKEVASASTPTHLFVFCADHEPGTSSLFQKVSDLVAQESNYPSFFTVIPMSFQSDETIAPLFFRSDMTCTRCGGQTAMELMATARGQIWIHSEAKKEAATNQELLDGIPSWESANAAYMQHNSGAKLVTPDHFMSYGRQLLLTPPPA